MNKLVLSVGSNYFVFPTDADCLKVFELLRKATWLDRRWNISDKKDRWKIKEPDMLTLDTMHTEELQVEDDLEGIVRLKTEKDFLLMELEGLRKRVEGEVKEEEK